MKYPNASILTDEAPATHMIVDKATDILTKVTANQACMYCFTVKNIQLRTLTKCPPVALNPEGATDTAKNIVGCSIIPSIISQEGSQTVKQYLGIPYADPPINERRFSRTQLFSGTFSPMSVGFFYGNACPQTCQLPWNSCPCNETGPGGFLCNQMGIVGDAFRASQTTQNYGSEDCLNLNVWTPLDAPQNKYPVLIFIHGGSFRSGTANVKAFSGEKLAAKGLVVVNMNYRMGVFGFYADGTDAFKGNYGFHDQVLSLEWVKQNIAKFGGDPSRVTISGQSAGGTSVIMHLTSKLSTGLFHAAILQSAPYSLPFNLRHLPIETLQDFATATGCEKGDAACLRNRSMTEIRLADVASNKGAFDGGLAAFKAFIKKASPYMSQYAYNFGPVIDTDDEQAFNLIRSKEGLVNKVPILTGSLDEEGAVFARLYWLADRTSSIQMNEYLTRPTLRRILGTILPQSIIFETMFGIDFKSRVFAAYPPDFLAIDPVNNLFLMSDMFTDLFFKCPARNVTNSLAANNEVPLYVYYMDASYPTDLPWSYFCAMRACHGIDLAFTLGGGVETVMNDIYVTKHRQISDALQRTRNKSTWFRSRVDYGQQKYWIDEATPQRTAEFAHQIMNHIAQFVKTHNPNLEGSTEWTPYTLQNPQMMSLSLASSAGGMKTFDDKMSRCVLWDQIGYFW
eukprot:c7857_g1_i1.p1 GENE.c7857_g1_i1~~c7857_g1_i1.p1  ORF type:complete len:750 (-),score=167.69 c7857_g1_i1:10-2052(-)